MKKSHAVVVKRAAPAPRDPNGWIRTASGGRFWPLDPRGNEVRLEDVAHALSNVARYTGHAEKFYSVAEHSVRALWLCEARFKPHAANHEETNALRLNLYRWALLHDASEAYLCDVSAPIKRAPEFAGYRAAERRLMRAIAHRFNLEGDQPFEVGEVDRLMLASEWPFAFPGSPPVSDLDPLPVCQGFGWSPTTARQHFLAAAARLDLQ